MFNFKITRTMKKTLSLIIALALLMGAKAFAQELEWEWRGLTTNDEFYEINTPYETSDGRILVTGRTGYLEDCYSFNRWYKPTPTLMSLSSDGEELFQRQYHKDGYFTYVPYVLENSSGEVFLFITYSPHHDTCSPNYFRNFDPPTDHCIFGLYKLNDDLSIAESHELEIPIDTFEWRNNNQLMHYNCGQLLPISAFVDDDGNIVGAYVRTVSYDPYKPRGYDSTVFFRMDFEGNILNHKSYCGNRSSGAMQRHLQSHIVKADSLYLFYGYKYDIVGDESNLAYLDHDFNLVRTRNFRHPSSVHPATNFYFQSMSVVRSPHGTTYLTCALDSNDDNWYHAILYEYNDDVNGSGNYTPIVRYADRKSEGHCLDWPVDWSGVQVLGDSTIYYAYTLHQDWFQRGDSWIVIEHLTPEFNTISTVFFGEENDRKSYWAYGITATEDGGVVLVSWELDLLNDVKMNVVRKYPANALVGIDEAHANGLKVAIAYPNPGKETLNIRTGLKDARVEVYDMSGRMVYGQEITEDVTSIDAEGWPAGVYVWRVMANGREAESGKWIKEQPQTK